MRRKDPGEVTCELILPQAARGGVGGFIFQCEEGREVIEGHNKHYGTESQM